MKQRQFEALNASQWQDMETLLDQLEAVRQQAVPDHPAVRDFPQRYRRICHQHALAIERGYSLALVDRLNSIILRGRRQLYRFRLPVAGPLRELLLAGFPRAVRGQGAGNLASAGVFLFSLVLVWALVSWRPEMVYALLDEQSVSTMESMYDPASSLAEDRDGSDDVTMFGYYIYNNIGIAFRTFAGGLFFGIGALFIMFFNGGYFGAVAGHLVNVQHHEPFFTFVIAHGAPELTAIVLAGGCGLRLGWSLIAPGPRTRLAALKDAANQAMPVMYGVFFLLLAAAFIEAFWSPRDLPAAVKYSVGGTLWVGVLAYLLLAGRRWGARHAD